MLAPITPIRVAPLLLMGGASCFALRPRPSLGRERLHAQRVNGAAHPIIQDAVDPLLRLDAVEPGELLGHDDGAEMTASILSTSMAGVEMRLVNDFDVGR